MKSFCTMAAGGTVLAGFCLMLAAAGLVLVVIPGGLGILTLEWERFKRGWSHPLAFAHILRNQ